MRLVGWLIAGFVFYLAATGQLMNYINLALGSSSPVGNSSGAASGSPSGLSGSILQQVIPGLTGASASGTTAAGTTGAAASGAILA